MQEFCRDMAGYFQYPSFVIVVSLALVSLPASEVLACVQYGEDAIKEGMGGGGGGGGMDIFDLFTGGGGRRGGQTRERKSEDVVHQLAVSLEDLYTGTTK
jgi:hypothetical protein